MIKIAENNTDKFKRSYKGYYFVKDGIILYFNKDKIYTDAVCVYKPIDSYINRRIYEITQNLISLGVLELIED